VLHLIRVSISLGLVAFFILNQYLFQSVPAVLQNGHWCKRVSWEGSIDIEWSTWGEELIWASGPTVFA
jgi:hypothetical protein